MEIFLPKVNNQNHDLYRIMFDALTQLHFDYASTAWSYLTLFFPIFPFDPHENIRISRSKYLSLSVFSRSKYSEFSDPSLRKLNSINQVGVMEKGSERRKFKTKKTRNSFASFIMMSGFLILLRAFRGTYTDPLQAIIVLFVLEVLFCVIIALCNICEVIYTIKVVKGGTPLV